MLEGIDFDTRLNWVHQMAPLTRHALSKFKTDLKGVRFACAAHFDVKLVPLFETLLSQGAELHLSPCVPGVVFTDSFQYLQARGAKIYGVVDQDWEELEKTWRSMIGQKPHYVFDMGGGLIAEASRARLELKAASEATGTGIGRLANLKLGFPVFNWDDLRYKEVLHNRYDVGNGVWHSFRQLTGLDICRLRVLVLGFGHVGKSVAATARGLGARVVVCEKNPLLLIEAASEGYQTSDLAEAIPFADVLITATGARGVVTGSSLKKAKSGLFLGNAGHDDREIDLSDSKSISEILPQVEQVKLHDKSFYLLARGTLLNLSTGGAALNTFDYITALMARVIEYMLQNREKHSPGIHVFPESAIEDLIQWGARKVLS